MIAKPSSSKSLQGPAIGKTSTACRLQQRVRANIRLLSLAALLALAACETPQEQVSHREDNLAAAGFVVRPANTPERQSMLDRLPPNRFVRRVHGDDVTYVYADPIVCDCLYVGSQQAYASYQRYRQQKNLADEQQTTAQLYTDPTWNWGVWGYPAFGFGPGLGW